MIGRASTLLVVAALGVSLTGCQTTQEKSAELQRQAEQEQRREAAAEQRTKTETDARPKSKTKTDSGSDR
ncbi:MAG: hypothetical protein WC558_11830 [Patulibacter sp.]